MTRWKDKLLGAATMWPIVYVGLFMCFVGSQIALFASEITSGNTASNGEPPQILGTVFMGGMGLIFVLHFLTILEAIALLIYYIFDVFHNPRLDDDDNTRLLWVLALFIGNMFAMPIYWYINIWSRPAEPSSSGPAAHDGLLLRGMAASGRHNAYLVGRLNGNGGTRCGAYIHE